MSRHRCAMRAYEVIQANDGVPPSFNPVKNCQDEDFASQDEFEAFVRNNPEKFKQGGVYMLIQERPKVKLRVETSYRLELMPS